MSIVGGNPPVLVGPVPLFYVQSLTLTEGYKYARLLGSTFSQALTPSAKTIEIVAILPGQSRLLYKKALEGLGMITRLSAAAAAPLMSVAGIPVVAGMTVSTDMQITDLTFVQSVEKGREVLHATIKLLHVPRTTLSLAAGEALDLALATTTALLPSVPPPNPVTRTV